MQAVRKVKAGGAPAPSGIPVASAANVIISNAEIYNGAYAKKIPEQAFPISGGHISYLKTGTCYSNDNILLLSPNAQVWDNEVGAILDTPFGVWKLIDPSFDTDLDSWVYTIYTSNSSTNANYIPTTVWSPSDIVINRPTYVSRIIISGSSTPNFNGTYNASVVPSYGNEYPDRVDSYTFNGPSGVAMSWNPYEVRYDLFADGSGYTGGFGSGDGITWGPIETYIKEIVVSGFTSPVEANGNYLLDGIGSGLWVNQNSFYIQSGELYSDATELIATNDNNYDGSWTLVSGSGSPTSSAFYAPSGSISGSIITSTI